VFGALIPVLIPLASITGSDGPGSFPEVARTVPPRPRRIQPHPNCAVIRFDLFMGYVAHEATSFMRLLVILSALLGCLPHCCLSKKQLVINIKKRCFC